MKMEVANDAGPAAVKIDQEILDLRKQCDRLNITYHWKHRAPGLRKLIEGNNDQAKQENTVELVEVQSVTVTGGDGNAKSYATRRTIPKDVSAALDYMEAYKRANAKLVRSFIESLL